MIQVTAKFMYIFMVAIFITTTYSLPYTKSSHDTLTNHHEAYNKRLLYLPSNEDVQDHTTKRSLMSNNIGFGKRADCNPSCAGNSGSSGGRGCSAASECHQTA